MSITNYAESALIQHLTGEAAYTPAATLYVALCTADPTDAATGASCNETANAGGYARQAITFAAASGGSIAQSGQIDFPQASADYASPITHYCIVDSATYGAGNALAYGAFSASKTINTNNTPYIADGEITIDRGGSVSNYLANKLLGLMFRNTAYTAPSIYVGLATVAVTAGDDGSTITEPSGNGYARTQISSWAAESGGATSNSAQTDIGPATGSWSTPVSDFLIDSSSGAGNILFFNDIAVGDQQAVGNGDTWRYAAGDYAVSLA